MRDFTSSERYLAFQGDNFFLIFSTAELHIDLGVLPRHEGNLKYEGEKVSTLQPINEQDV